MLPVRRHSLVHGTKVASVDALDVVERPAYLKNDLRVHVFAAPGAIELVAKPVRLGLADARRLRDALDHAIALVESRAAHPVRR